MIHKGVNKMSTFLDKYGFIGVVSLGITYIIRNATDHADALEKMIQKLKEGNWEIVNVTDQFLITAKRNEIEITVTIEIAQYADAMI
ncbi:hypothetical protein C5B42_03950 [Candidatus Cerribacteria bacterium 'Amazon FNV 2010 28 9']|uniref:Uncharacterized protein n=1 Tax=Candidatus Cerribacteria bacterium 'Amazon FNV 2010 28 9' TaxID=2081795 RepID=A0A317JSA7_9BACT|nr:MAG: hypothetical protein C5B42_03950 [Candidatus Cerribacteria bacterium 'Amazon FNV 2010 28 9']